MDGPTRVKTKDRLYKNPPTGPTKAKTHFYMTFLFSLMGLISANNPQVPVLMLWSLSYTMAGTMIATVTTYRPPMFHVDLYILLGWKALPQSVLGGRGRHGYGYGYHNTDCGHLVLESNLSKHSFYACQWANQIVGDLRIITPPPGDVRHKGHG